MEYHGLSYAYTDKDGEVHRDSIGNNPRMYSGNLSAGEEVVFDMKYRMLPILENGEKLLDTLVIEKPLVLKMPTSDQPFIPQELEILQANGVGRFTTADVEGVSKLTYPMNMSTFADLFYFPNVHELDLTGKGLKGI